MIGVDRCLVTLPDVTGNPFDPIDSFCQLLVAESAELAAELGCLVEFGRAGTATGAAGRCFVGPSSLNRSLRDWLADMRLPVATEPLVRIDRERRVVVIDGPAIGDIGAAFQMLRTAIRSGERVYRQRVPGTSHNILETIREEVADT